MFPTKVYRNELKYSISITDYKYLSEVFRRTLEGDPHGNDKNKYWIRSLYLDTLENADYYEKIIGTSNRKKIRLRIYDINQPKVKLEIKNKYEQYVLKETTEIDREDAKEIVKGNKEVLLHYQHYVSNKAYYLISKDYYRPAILVDYEREAYTCPIQNIRLTLDQNIRTSIIDLQLFGENLNLVPVFKEPTFVLEIKYHKIFPAWIKEILSNCDVNREAMSKYCMSRNLF